MAKPNLCTCTASYYMNPRWSGVWLRPTGGIVVKVNALRRCSLDISCVADCDYAHLEARGLKSPFRARLTALYLLQRPGVTRQFPARAIGIRYRKSDQIGLEKNVNPKLLSPSDAGCSVGGQPHGAWSRAMCVEYRCRPRDSRDRSCYRPELCSAWCRRSIW